LAHAGGERRYGIVATIGKADTLESTLGGESHDRQVLARRERFVQIRLVGEQRRGAADLLFLRQIVACYRCASAVRARRRSQNSEQRRFSGAIPAGDEQDSPALEAK